jgi:ELWxxDGT repeat protein
MNFKQKISILTFVLFGSILTGFAQTPYLVKDIDPGSGSSNPGGEPLDINGTLFFRAGGGQGNELWKSDGTASGTVLVKDIDPTTNGSSSGDYTNVNGTLFFHANDGTTGKELWKSDGTAAGTMLVEDITPGSADTDLDFFVNVGGRLVFTVKDNTNGMELWRSDGTASGTYLLQDIAPGSDDGISWNVQTDYVSFNGKLYFQAEDPTNADELWVSDGTTAGTVLLKDIAPGNNGSGPEFFVVSNNTVYFIANDGTGSAIWKTDGTASGTVLCFTLPFGTYLPAKIVDANGTMFFPLYDSFVSGVELWKSDGTSSGSVMVADINPGTGNSNPSLLSNVNGTLFFRADDGVSGGELWKTDGTTSGTVMVKDIYPGSSGGLTFSEDLINLNGILYFSAIDSANGLELWSSDGTSNGTNLVMDINPGAIAFSTPAKFAVSGNNLFFSATDGATGIELWSLQSASSGLNELYAGETESVIVYPNPANEYISISVNSNQLEVFDISGRKTIINRSSFGSYDISALAQGMYFVRSTAENGKQLTFKFCKN